jgi:hypothetical protein
MARGNLENVPELILKASKNLLDKVCDRSTFGVDSFAIVGILEARRTKLLSVPNSGRSRARGR